MPDALRNDKYYDGADCFDNLYKDSVHGTIFYDLADVITTTENIMLAYGSIKRNSGNVTAGVDRVIIAFRYFLPKKEHVPY